MLDFIGTILGEYQPQVFSEQPTLNTDNNILLLRTIRLVIKRSLNKRYRVVFKGKEKGLVTFITLLTICAGVLGKSDLSRHMSVHNALLRSDSLSSDKGKVK